MMFNECASVDTNIINVNSKNITKETAIGCMTFIGELYICDLLTNKIINSCFLLLLMKIEQNKGYIIDSICILMKVCGKVFTTKCPNDSKIIFEKIEKMISMNILQNKEKYALMDIIDLKNENGW